MRKEIIDRSALLFAATAALALPGDRHAGELTYWAGVLTYMGGDAVDNNVSATPTGQSYESAHRRRRDATRSARHRLRTR